MHSMIARRALLAVGWIPLWLATGGCSHTDWLTTPSDEALPAPEDPAYPTEVLRVRAECMRAVERWRHSLEALDRLIEFRQAGRISRDRSRKIVGISDDSDLHRWRMEMEYERLRAQGALRRLERKVRTDFHGEFPPWWPKDDG